MSKKLHDVVKKSEDIRKITEAIAHGIPTHIEESLEDLGFDVRVSEVDFGNRWATITIEGGENETGVILTLQLAKIEIGFDSMTVRHAKGRS